MSGTDILGILFMLALIVSLILYTRLVKEDSEFVKVLLILPFALGIILHLAMTIIFKKVPENIGVMFGVLSSYLFIALGVILNIFNLVYKYVRRKRQEG